MFQTFLQWCLSLFGYRQRALFRFHDGTQFRRIDPLESFRRLISDSEFDWDATPQMLKAGYLPVELQTMGIIGRAVRRAFDIPDPSAGGLADSECLDLLTEFHLHFDDVKKNGSLFRTLSEPTVLPSIPDIFPTKPGLDFGSTEIEHSPEPHGSPAVEIPSSSAATPSAH